jgi:hypothetical protein
MSKKHFKLLADYIQMILDPHARLQAAVAVASACKLANARFDEQRFFAACGIGAPAPLGA